MFLVLVPTYAMPAIAPGGRLVLSELWLAHCASSGDAIARTKFSIPKITFLRCYQSVVNITYLNWEAVGLGN